MSNKGAILPTLANLALESGETGIPQGLTLPPCLLMDCWPVDCITTLRVSLKKSQVIMKTEKHTFIEVCVGHVAEFEIDP